MRRILISQRRDSVIGRSECRDALDVRWSKLLFELGYLPIPVCSELAVNNEYISQLCPDGILLTGGNDIGTVPERDALEAQLLKFSKNHNIPVLGVCRGMQMINIFCGGVLVDVKGHVATRHTLYGEWANQQAYTHVNSYHNLAVTKDTIADSLSILATSDDNVVEAFKHSALPWLGIMWHPEREQEITLQDKELFKLIFGCDDEGV